MVTGNAARAFRMQDRIGVLEAGKWADILVLTGRTDDPFENMAGASMEDIELVTLGGKPLYGDMRFLDLLGGSLPPGYSTITVGAHQRFVIGEPGDLYRGVRQKVGFKKKLDFLPFELDT
jgi:cytosine/adenosine deaminase-related metal-dependent hydrolase